MMSTAQLDVDKVKSAGQAPLRIMVVSTPKTGNTWIKHLLSAIYDLPLEPLKVLFTTEEMDALGERWIGQQHYYPLPRLLRWAEENGVVLVTTVAIDVTAPLLPRNGVSDDPLLNALYGGAVLGAAAALIIRAYGNVGGTSILARVMQRRTGMPLGQIYLLTDGLIVLLVGFAFGWERALYSMVALFVYGVVTDYVMEGPSIVRTVFIVTDRPREMAAALQTQLRTGVTAWRGEGMYHRGERSVLFCTVNRSEVRELTRIVRELDHHGFLVVGQGQRAAGGTIGRSDAPG